MRANRRLALLLALGLLLALAGASSGGAARAQAPPVPAEALRATSGAGEQLERYVRGLEEAPAPAGMGGAAGGDASINNPALDTPEQTTQSETTLAVRGSTICAGFNDSGTGGFSGFARSLDGGATWNDLGGIGQFGDPVLAVHRASGTFYYAENAFLGGATAIGVAKSTDNCNSFAAPVNASAASAAPADLQDKPWIAVDNSGGAHDGTVYVCWTRFVANFPGPPTSDEIRFARSVDGGATFVNEQVVSPGTDFYPFGCTVDVAANGAVYVAWTDRGSGTPVRFRRSLDGGVTFPAPAVQVNSAAIRHPGIDRVVVCDSFRTTLVGDIRTLSMVWMAVDTTGGMFNGNIYLVWQYDPVGAVDNSDVYFSRSTDGGLTWSPEVQIGGGSVTDQFEPNVEVGGAGTVAIAWYDRRNDPANNLNIDVYTAFSLNGGASFGPPTRVTNVSFPVPPLLGQPTGSGQFDPVVKACYMGEYIALAADTTKFYYAWGDNRNTVVSANYPSGRPDPDVYFDVQTVLPISVGGSAKLSDVAAAPLDARPWTPDARALAGIAIATAFVLVTGACLATGRRRSGG